jgi:hypothetical protein
MLLAACRAALARTAGGGWPHRRSQFIKKKRAARGRRTGNHCGRHRILKGISGNAAAGARRRFIFAFYSPMKIVCEQRGFVKGGGGKGPSNSAPLKNRNHVDWDSDQIVLSSASDQLIATQVDLRLDRPFLLLSGARGAGALSGRWGDCEVGAWPGMGIARRVRTS